MRIVHANGTSCSAHARGLPGQCHELRVLRHGLLGNLRLRPQQGEPERRGLRAAEILTEPPRLDVDRPAFLRRQSQRFPNKNR